MKQVILIGLVLVLAGCGGAKRDRGDVRVSRATPIAYGPISKACLQSDRERRSQSLCTCIQAAADQTLSRSDQRRSVAFYEDPHLAQQIRQSDRAKDEEFWNDYTSYGERAEQMCG